MVFTTPTLSLTSRMFYKVNCLIDMILHDKYIFTHFGDNVWMHSAELMMFSKNKMDCHTSYEVRIYFYKLYNFSIVYSYYN
jgi:hypothetical protein